MQINRNDTAVVFTAPQNEVFYSEASQRRSLRTGPPLWTLDGSSPSLKTTPSCPGFPLGKSSATPAPRACAASLISSPNSATRPCGGRPPQST